MSGSSTSRKSTGGVPETFPAGLRVLVVDDDPTCLMILERMLKQCNYEAIICNKAEIALSLLRENNEVCDIVLSDVHMPDMDGFKLLEHIGLEMDIPVIMMSADDSKDVMMKGITHGAYDYIIKPVRIEALRAIWQHVVRKKQKQKEFKPLTSADDFEQSQKVLEDVEDTSSGNKGRNWKNIKRKEYEDDSEEREETSYSKKARVVWSIELHQKFVAAVNKLGLHRSVPKKILELMNVPGITRENIASHLQKYRIYLKRLNESKQPTSIDASFIGTLDQGYDHPAIAGMGQFPGQSLTPLQTSVLDRLNNSRSPVPMPLIDQRNTFNFGNPRYYGNPTNMEPNRFLGLHQSHQYPYGGNSQVLRPIIDQSQLQSQNQTVFASGLLTQGLGSNISGSGIVPSYNFLNGSNQNRPDSGSPNMTFTDWLSNSSSKTMGPTLSFAVDESATHPKDTTNNQDDILSALLDQPKGGVGQPEDELEFDGYAFDDLPRAT